MEQKVRAIRVELDGLAHLTGLILEKSRENSLAKTSFETSKMMLGKVLQTLGTANPYPESKNPASAAIEPTAETAFVYPDLNGLDYIAQVKTVRKLADDLCTKLEAEHFAFSLTANSPTKWKTLAFLQESWMECQKAMMWLGMELGRIRDREETTMPAPMESEGTVSMVDKTGNVATITDPDAPTIVTEESNNNPQTNN